MLGFMIGCVVGGVTGLTTACLCSAAHQADAHIDSVHSSASDAE